MLRGRVLMHLEEVLLYLFDSKDTLNIEHMLLQLGLELVLLCLWGFLSV